MAALTAGERPGPSTTVAQVDSRSLFTQVSRSPYLTPVESSTHTISLPQRTQLPLYLASRILYQSISRHRRKKVPSGTAHGRARRVYHVAAPASQLTRYFPPAAPIVCVSAHRQLPRRPRSPNHHPERQSLHSPFHRPSPSTKLCSISITTSTSPSVLFICALEL